MNVSMCFEGLFIFFEKITIKVLQGATFFSKDSLISENI